MPERLFGTDGVRGRAGVSPLDVPTLRRIGAALVRAFGRAGGPRSLLIGRDTRESGAWIERELTHGALSLMFVLRHLLVKKFEDYFFREKIYKYAHVPRPLGSISRQDDKPFEAYLYEWAFGNEGFPWEVSEYGGGKLPVRLRDWNQFVDQFHQVGIDLGADVADSSDAKVSKNIIHQFPFDYPHDQELNPIWKRIDFGPASAPMDYEGIMQFLCDNRESLITVLRGERYQMMVLATKYLDWSTRATVSDYEFGELETLIGYSALIAAASHLPGRLQQQRAAVQRGDCPDAVPPRPVPVGRRQAPCSTWVVAYFN